MTMVQRYIFYDLKILIIFLDQLEGGLLQLRHFYHCLQVRRAH
jgi:hypothetical protein